MSGHLFIVRGDLLHLACDAVLVPSGTQGGRRGHITEVWRGSAPHQAGFVTPAPEGRQRVVKVRDGRAGGPAIWLGHTGDTGTESAAWYAKAITAFIDQAVADPSTVSGARPRPLRDGRPLLGVPMVGIGQGGMAERKGQVVAAVVSAIQDRLEHLEVDVALVTQRSDAYAAAQQARHRGADDRWPDLPAAHQSEITRLAQEARRRGLVLFMGAGTGIGAGLPSWKDLLGRLAAEAGMTEVEQQELDTLDPRDAGAAIEQRLGADLPRRIKALTASPRSSLVHQLLASLPVDEAITTNYDTLFEQAWRDAGHDGFAVLPHRPNRSADRWLLKLHGSVDDLANVVLSRGDYLRFEGRGAALAGIVHAMLLTRHLLFVGYSLSDDNFHRIAHQVRGVLDSAAEGPPTAFGTALTPSPLGLSSSLWRDEVRFVSTADTAAVPMSTSPERQVAIALDRLGYEASGHTAHLLDPSYKAVFNGRELALRAALDKARRLAQDDAVRPSLAQAVDEALASIKGQKRSGV